jgi:formylglycine-generating enzyme required for sulfatase activity
VGSFSQGASPYGLLDMAGNVWELTSSLDLLYPYTTNGERERLDASGRRIARGGCYANPQGFARCACRFRFSPTVRTQFLGFRLALSLDV